MQTLKLADKFFPPLNAGKRHGTIRKGVLQVTPGPLTFVGVTNTNLTKTVNVTNVYTVLMHELSAKEALMVGAASVEKLQENLKRFYPKLENNSILTIVEFE